MENKKAKKQGTKGAKQIVEENKSTLKFYLQMIVTAEVAYFAIKLTSIFVFDSKLNSYQMLFVLLSIGAQIGSFKFLQIISKPNISENGSLIDSGTDLCMEGGLAEHVKDVIILCIAVQFLSLFSFYFWLGLLLIPARGFHLAWGTVIKPWLSSKTEENDRVDEKKQKKIERRQKRYASIRS